MNTYVLVEGKNMETSWYEMLKEKDEEKIDRHVSKFSNGMANQFINGRPGLNMENMDKFLWQFINNIYGYLNEGHAILFNRVGGMTILTKDMRILKTINDTWFPHNKEDFGLSGWLTPNGEFYKCEHGEHWKFAQEKLNNERESLQEIQYVSMGSLGYDFDKSSHLFVPINGFTDEQKKWFENNYKYLDFEQKRIYDESIKNL